MELNVLERFVIIHLLPKQGTMLELIATKNIREAIQFSEEEVASLKVEQSEGQLQWDQKAAVGIIKPVDFTGPQTKLIVERLTTLDTEKKLTPDHLSLCEKFGIGGE